MLCKPDPIKISGWKSDSLRIHSPNAKFSAFLLLCKTVSVNCYHSKPGTVLAQENSREGSYNQAFFQKNVQMQNSQIHTSLSETSQTKQQRIQHTDTEKYTSVTSYWKTF